MTLKETYLWLSEIESQLQLTSVLKFDLFKASQKILRNDIKAISYIAILLQDTSPARTHLFYLKRYARSNSLLLQANIQKLESVLEKFINLQAAKKWKNEYFLYPQSIESLKLPLSGTQYHFYVLSWNSSKMMKVNRPKSAAKIVFINTMFNFLYERFHQMKLSNLLIDSAPLNSKSAADVRLGFLGSFI
ncbi:MAG: hypothetical protein ACK5V3_14400, partial [Bdellovibrionales bacterium]